jgi:hypothetical protein
MNSKGWLTDAFADTTPEIYPGIEAGAYGKRRRPAQEFFGDLLASARALLPWARHEGDRSRSGGRRRAPQDDAGR